jgi:hypothetical protein
MIPIKTFDPKKQATVLAGMLDGTTFYKDCTDKAHYMVVYRGYGIQAIVVDSLKRAGCTTVVIETKTEILTSSLQDWIDHGTHDNNVRAHGHQIFLEACMMQSEPKDAKKA